MDPAFYDADYFENGIASGKSCYENYRWIPELTIPLAMSLIDHLNITRIDTILDFGCAKGYLVKALRLLHRRAWGIDRSEYAIRKSDVDIQQYLMVVDLIKVRGLLDLVNREAPSLFDLCIAKDVLEHIPHSDLSSLLRYIPSRRLFVVVPLGDGNGKYVIPSYHLDKSHVVCEPIDWWVDLFVLNGWRVDKLDYRVPGIKENWTKRYGKGNGFFVLERSSCSARGKMQ